MTNELTQLTFVGELVVSALLVLGGAFALVGAIGMARFGDFFQRLHAPTKATTLGVGGLLSASMVAQWLQGDFGINELLITLFIFVTAPISANLLSEAALHQRLPSAAPLPSTDELAEPQRH